MMAILAIDPGNIESGFCVMREDYVPVIHGKCKNEDLLELIDQLCDDGEIDRVVIEMIASYGMAVGKTVFDTCVWIGRFTQTSLTWNVPVDYVYRKEEKMMICGSMKAKDSNIRQALIDRFAQTERGVGTKKNPDFFYGFAKDQWMAFAVGTVWYDKRKLEIEQKVV